MAVTTPAHSNGSGPRAVIRRQMGLVEAISVEAIGLGLATKEVSKGRHCENSANWVQGEREKRRERNQKTESQGTPEREEKVEGDQLPTGDLRISHDLPICRPEFLSPTTSWLIVRSFSFLHLVLGGFFSSEPGCFSHHSPVMIAISQSARYWLFLSIPTVVRWLYNPVPDSTLSVQYSVLPLPHKPQ